jgi:hypothetical protein
MRRTRLAVVLLLAGCAIGMPAGPPGGRTARFSPTDRDPVGFLLLNRDSLSLADSVVQRLVQLNLRLFRRNQALQNQIDSAMRDVKVERRAPVDSSKIAPGIREFVEPLSAQIHAQTAAVKDTAWSWLLEEQKVKADSLEARQTMLMRRGQPPTMAPGRPAQPY